MATLLLPQDQIDEQMLMLDNWNLEDNDVGQLTKEFEFENFNQAIEFVNKVTKSAEELNHHPDILIHSQKIVELMITSYEYEGITQKCLDLALAIDALE